MSTPPFIELPEGVWPDFIPRPYGRMAALRAGERGPSVLLVPGFTGSKEDFLPLLPLIAKAGFQVTAVDLPGQYQSDGPAEVAAYTLDLLASDILDVAASLDRPHLVGHSLGGLIARQATLANPRRFGSLTLLNSGPAALPHPGHLDALLAALPVLSQQQIWEAKQVLDAEAGVPHPPAPVANFLHERWLSTSAVSMAGMAEILKSAPDRTAELAQIPIPVQVVFGEEDEDTWPLPIQIAMAEGLSVELHIIKEAGHSPAVEQPDATARILIQYWKQSGVPGNA